MKQYVLKRMLSEWKETIGNICLVSCVMTVLIVCFQIGARIKEIIDNKWYKESLEIIKVHDPFISDKMGVIMSVILAVLVVVCIFCLILYALKLKMDIIKESRWISVFQILGYTNIRRIATLYLGKILEMSFAFLLGTGVSYGVWDYLCKQEKFYELMIFMEERAVFDYAFAWMSFGILAVESLLIISLVIKFRTSIMDIKGEER